jgi:hypothetical protein
MEAQGTEELVEGGGEYLSIALILDFQVGVPEIPDKVIAIYDSTSHVRRRRVQECGFFQLTHSLTVCSMNSSSRLTEAYSSLYAVCTRWA